MIEKFLRSRSPLIKEMFLYGVIGGSTALLDIVLFHLFLAAGIPLFVANFISVNIAIGASFALNARFNFRKTDNLPRRAAKFFSVGYFGLLISFAILWIGVDLMGLSETLVKVFSVIVVAGVQYLLNKFLTFKG